MGKKEEEFRKRIAVENKHPFEMLSGQYTPEETEFLKRINQEDDLGFKKANDRENSKIDLNIIPSEEEMQEYINKSLEGLLGKQKEDNMETREI